MFNFRLKTLKGVSPPPLWLSRCDNSRTGATSSSLSAGAAWGDRHCPLLHSYQHLEFHINGKGILQSRYFVKRHLQEIFSPLENPGHLRIIKNG